jgi:hypothetical protein
VNDSGKESSQLGWYFVIDETKWKELFMDKSKNLAEIFEEALRNGWIANEVTND